MSRAMRSWPHTHRSLSRLGDAQKCHVRAKRETSACAAAAETELFDPGDVGSDMGDGSLCTLELSQKGAITTVVSTMDYHTKQARDAAVATGMTDGMEQSYAGLDALLPELR
jgi:hypothetical protein